MKLNTFLRFFFEKAKKRLLQRFFRDFIVFLCFFVTLIINILSTVFPRKQAENQARLLADKY